MSLGTRLLLLPSASHVAGLSSVSKFALVEDLTSLVFFKNTECSTVYRLLNSIVTRESQFFPRIHEQSFFC